MRRAHRRYGANLCIAQLPNYTRTVLGGDGHVVTFLLALFSVGVAIPQRRAVTRPLLLQCNNRG